MVFWKKKEIKKMPAAPKTGASKAKLEAEDAIRDIINWVEVKNIEEVQGADKKIEDSTAKQLNSKLRALAKKVGKI